MKTNAHLILTAILCVLVGLLAYENWKSHSLMLQAEQVLMQHAVFQSELQLLTPCEVPSAPRDEQPKQEPSDQLRQLKTF
jgi:hypothetical protein